MTRHSERESATPLATAACWPTVRLRWGTELHSGSPLPPISGQRAARLQPQVPPPLAHPQPRYLSSTRKHPLSRFTGYLIVDLLVVDSHSCCCSHSCIVSPLCSAPMTSVSPCTIPQTRPTKLALMKGQDNKQRIRHAKQ